ncbi:hypothetical protein [Vulgatibacter sp.]|uniref:hypothetical protein n=1 Tax=Vulgatibacter sp. TaxID=1971226 RepID=UPI003563BADF
MVEAERRWLDLAALDVTLGTIDETADGSLLIRDPKVRAVSRGPAGDDAQLVFRYLGPTPQEAPLASGQLRRQIGLKLRALDSCNLLYVVWEVAPTPAIRILRKTNPDASRHVDCGVDGYEELAPPFTDLPPIEPRDGEHELRAALHGTLLKVWADGALVFAGEIAAAADLHGPAGLRSDNGRFELHLGLR